MTTVTTLDLTPELARALLEVRVALRQLVSPPPNGLYEADMHYHNVAATFALMVDNAAAVLTDDDLRAIAGEGMPEK